MPEAVETPARSRFEQRTIQQFSDGTQILLFGVPLSRWILHCRDMGVGAMARTCSVRSTDQVRHAGSSDERAHLTGRSTILRQEELHGLSARTDERSAAMKHITSSECLMKRKKSPHEMLRATTALGGQMHIPHMYITVGLSKYLRKSPTGLRGPLLLR